MFSRVETDEMVVDTSCNELLSSKKILGEQLGQNIKISRIGSGKINNWRWEFAKQDWLVYTKNGTRQDRLGDRTRSRGKRVGCIYEWNSVSSKATCLGTKIVPEEFKHL